jgi:ParB family chromosome partitioning protein
MARRSGLGRGLDALIPRTTVDPDAIREIALDDIAPNPRQPRQSFPEESLQELAESIRTHGIIQPLVVTYSGGKPPYQLVAGERRWRAARLAGLTTVPALVRDLSPKDAVEIALIENLQRADLSPLETAAAYRTLIEEFGLTQAEVAARVGKSRSAIANTLRLLEAPETIQRALAMGDITEGHARALLSLPDTASQLAALQEIRQRSLTVRQTEELVRRWIREKKPPRRTRSPLSPEIEHVLDALRSRLRTKVELRTSSRGGRLIIHYYSAEELARLIDELLRQAHNDHLVELG